MRFAEVFLRLGLSLVAWMVLFAYALWLMVVPQAACRADEVPLSLVLLYALPLVGIMLALLPASRKLPGVHDTLRWLAVPLGLLTLLAVIALVRSLEALTVPPCSTGSPLLDRFWVPVHLVTCAVLLVQAVRIFRTPQPVHP
ncbi:MAG: hypothetical protein AAF648_08470 [Pseudomonadota bacterium]